MMLFHGLAYAQKEQVRFRIRYVINNPVVDSAFIDNSDRILSLRDFLASAKEDSTLRFSRVKFRATASPDGGYEFNRWLSKERLKTFKELVSDYVDIPDSIIVANVSEISWDDFRKKVEESDIPHREKVLAIIDEGPEIVPWFNGRHIDRRLLKLKSFMGGKVWETLKSPILRDLRFGEVEFDYFHVHPSILPSIPLRTAAPYSVFSPDFHRISTSDTDVWIPRLHLKSNLLGLMLLIGNAGVEADIVPHLSVNIPVFYSALDYFSQKIKFRTLGVRPSLRYWPRSVVNEGFFADIHAGIAYYNLAFNGKYRRQDHQGRTPAYGGGVGVGYRLPLSGSWHLEFELGVGAYNLNYDLFENTDPTVDGPLVGRKKMIYIGPDYASVSFTYAFDLKPRFRKGGGKSR